MREILGHSVPKRWMNYGLILVAQMAVAVGCKDGGAGPGPAADYTLALTPAVLTIVQGANGPTAVTVTRTNFTDAVTLSLGNAPAGVTGSFTPSTPTGTSATLTVSVGAAVAPGVYHLTVAGAGTAGNRSTPLTLTVSAAPDYTLALAAAALTIVQGANGSTAVTVTRTNFTEAVTLSLGSAPAGVTGSFNPAAPSGTSATLTVSVGAAVAPAVYNLTVDGTGTAGKRSTPLTLTVSAAPDYTLALAPTALTIAPGTNAPTTVNITRANFNGAVTLSLGSAPAGVSGSFNPAAPTGTSATLTLVVGAAVAPGIYHLTVAGSGTAGDRSTPLTLTVSSSGGNGNVTTVDAGSFHSCALDVSRQAYCWGENYFGELGDGTTNIRLVPTQVAGGLTFAALSVDGDHACGLTAAGAAYCWGFNGEGELGDGTQTTRLVPTAVAGSLTFATLSAGGDHTCGVTTSGAAYCWGLIFNGGLEDGTPTYSFLLVPTAVAGGLTFAAVSAGGAHTCGVTTSGAAYCWGYNGYGALGDGTQTDQLVPNPVAGSLTFAALSAGSDFHTCGLTTTGAAYCWGYNGSGELGDGTTTDRLVPTPVAGALTFAAVSAGVFEHTCGTTRSGAAYCWGYNGLGVLGDGTTTDRLVPTLVVGGLTFAALSTGGSHTCGVTTGGATYCWGNNNNGQLGDGTTNRRLVPTAVAFP